MAAAVKAFIAGEVPAVALWVPFNIAVREALPDAVKLVDASAFYPQSAVLGGWAARMDFYAANRDVLARIIRAWAEANDHMVRNPAAAAEALQTHYGQSRPADIAEAFKAQKLYSSREWKRLYSDGTVVKWLQQVSDFFMTDAGVTTTRAGRRLFRHAALPCNRRLNLQGAQARTDTPFGPCIGLPSRQIIFQYVFNILRPHSNVSRGTTSGDIRPSAESHSSSCVCRARSRHEGDANSTQFKSSLAGAGSLRR